MKNINIFILKNVSFTFAKHLPLSGSLLLYHMHLVLFEAHLKNEVLTIKELFNRLPFSDLGIRFQLMKLVEQNFVLLKLSTVDRRVKFIQPETKLIAIWEQICYEIEASSIDMNSAVDAY